jgi:hypothetical protein
MAAAMVDMDEESEDMADMEERRVDSAVAMAEASDTSRRKRMLLRMSRFLFYIVASLYNIMLSIQTFSF